jgi:hypothetical protein
MLTLGETKQALWGHNTQVDGASMTVADVTLASASQAVIVGFRGSIISLPRLYLRLVHQPF